MQLLESIYFLRKKVCEYRLHKANLSEISSHVNAIDIVLSLSELGIKDKRSITKEEENWFRAGLYLSYVFAGSDWEIISIEFDKLVNEIEKNNYFRNI